MKRCIRIGENDNVATAIEPIFKNDEVLVFDTNQNEICKLIAQDVIPFGNKIALNELKKDDKVYKYNQTIAIVTKDIKKSTLVHIHNIKSPSVDIPQKIKMQIAQTMNETLGAKIEI